MSLSDLQDTIDDLLCHTCQDAARMSAVLNRARRMEYNHASVHALQAKLSVLVAESPPGAPTIRSRPNQNRLSAVVALSNPIAPCGVAGSPRYPEGVPPSRKSSPDGGKSIVVVEGMSEENATVLAALEAAHTDAVATRWGWRRGTRARPD